VSLQFKDYLQNTKKDIHKNRKKTAQV